MFDVVNPLDETEWYEAYVSSIRESYGYNNNAQLWAGTCHTNMWFSVWSPSHISYDDKHREQLVSLLKYIS